MKKSLSYYLNRPPFLYKRRPIIWYFTRHPFFYKTRFKLLLKSVSETEIEKASFNQHNSIEKLPQIFGQYTSEIFPEGRENLSDLDSAIQIALWLNKKIIGGPGLGTNSEKAIEKMLDGKFGVCSDIVQVFNIFCVVNEIKVREWGVNNFEQFRDWNMDNFEQFYGGHAFNEVYCNSRQKWVLLDVTKSLYFYEGHDKAPLSVFELFNLTKAGSKVQYYYFNKEKKKEPRYEKNIEQYYYNPENTPFLIVNYRNNVYDFFLKYLGWLPVPFIHGLVYIIGKSYKFYYVKNMGKEKPLHLSQI